MKRLVLVFVLCMLCVSIRVSAHNIASIATDGYSTIILTEANKDKTVKPNSLGRCITVKYTYDSYSKNLKFEIDKNLGVVTICLFNPNNGSIVNYSQLSSPGITSIAVLDAEEFEICLIDETARSYYGFVSV